MAGPVMQALVNARMQQINQTDAAIETVVGELLGPAPEVSASPPAEFIRWCETKGLPWRPASPASVALYVLENTALGIDPVLATVRSISAAHCSIGLADPTTAWPVNEALNRITKIEPPRSWPQAEKARFLSLPYELQAYLVPREKDRDRTVRLAQNEAGELRTKLAAL